MKPLSLKEIQQAPPLIYSHLLISLHLQLLYAVLFRIREVAYSEAISDINNPVRNPDTKTANILSSQIPPDAFYVFKKALDSGEFLTENSLDSILSYCLMKENVESLSSYMDVSEDLARRIINQQIFCCLFPVCICFKNQRADSDKSTASIASYYIKYPYCAHTDSLCPGSWLPQGKQ